MIREAALEPDPEADVLDQLLERAVTVPGVGGRKYILRAPTAMGLREIDAFQTLAEAERPALWATLLFAKCLYHSVNCEASGIRARTEDDWLRVLHASRNAPGLDLDKLVAASGRIFGFVMDPPASDTGESDHASDAAEGLGEVPS